MKGEECYDHVLFAMQHVRLAMEAGTFAFVRSLYGGLTTQSSRAGRKRRDRRIFVLQDVTFGAVYLMPRRVCAG